jgi:hypothetical protein
MPILLCVRSINVPHHLLHSSADKEATAVFRSSDLVP